MSGIFVARGMTLSLTNLSITLGSDGSLDSNVTPMVGFDACIPWLRIALEHADIAGRATSESHDTWTGADQAAKGLLLQQEFELSMQAIVAAATALDAFYSRIDTCINKGGTSQGENETRAWRVKIRKFLALVITEKRPRTRASRYAQIAETMRKAFKIRDNQFLELRRILKQIYSFRDQAVHPSGKFSAPVLHPSLNAGVEARFVIFRYTNAQPIVAITFDILLQLANKSHPTNKALKDYCSYLRNELALLRPRIVEPV